MEIAWAIGAGSGLASLCGFRALVPLTVFVVFARLDIIWSVTTKDTPFDFMQSYAVIGALVLLALIEIVITYTPSLSKIERTIRLPLGIVAGAIVFTALLSGPLASPLYLIGVPAGAAVALLGWYVRGGIMMLGGGRDPGPAMDLLVLILSVAAAALPPAGYLLFAAVVVLALRVRRMKKMKYKGLRVLA